MIKHEIIVARTATVHTPIQQIPWHRPNMPQRRFLTKIGFDNFINECPFKVGDFVAYTTGPSRIHGIAAVSCVVGIEDNFDNVLWDRDGEPEILALCGLSWVIHNSQPYRRKDSIKIHRKLTEDEFKDLMSVMTTEEQRDRIQNYLQQQKQLFNDFPVTWLQRAPAANI